MNKMWKIFLSSYDFSFLQYSKFKTVIVLNFKIYTLILKQNAYLKKSWMILATFLLFQTVFIKYKQKVLSEFKLS